MKSILYISRSLLPDGEAASKVEAILELARDHNHRAGITGALIFTGRYFAQLIEGPHGPTDGLMSRICLDPRHDRVNILSVQPCSIRRFGQWDMAYSGLSSYVDRHIRPLFQDLSEAERVEGHDALVELMLAFTGPSQLRFGAAR